MEKFGELGYKTDNSKIHNELDGTNKMKVFTNPATKEVTIVYRGTNLS